MLIREKNTEGTNVSNVYIRRMWVDSTSPSFLLQGFSTGFPVYLGSTKTNTSRFQIDLVFDVEGATVWSDCKFYDYY